MKGVDIYTIYRGWHYCNALAKRFRLINTAESGFSFELTEEHWYPQKVVQHSGKNKIIGRSWGGLVHHNSVRVVYKAASMRNMFHLWWYWYDGGERHSTYIGCVGRGSYLLTQRRHGNSVSCALCNFLAPSLDAKITIAFRKGKLKNWGFWCFPYAGGRDAAYFRQRWRVVYY